VDCWNFWFHPRRVVSLWILKPSRLVHSDHVGIYFWGYPGFFWLLFLISLWFYMRGENMCWWGIRFHGRIFMEGIGAYIFLLCYGCERVGWNIPISPYIESRTIWMYFSRWAKEGTNKDATCGWEVIYFFKYLFRFVGKLCMWSFKEENSTN